jgi:DNA-binding MarR family transcriptional regulator
MFLVKKSLSENIHKNPYNPGMTSVESGSPCQRAVLQESNLNWLLHRAAHRLGTALDEKAQQHGVGIRGYVVLMALLEQPGRTQLALGHSLGLDKTTLTALLDKMQANGLVVRRDNPNDRRSRIPEITDAGRTLQAQLVGELADVESQVLGGLAHAEREQLRLTLAKVVAPSLDGTPDPGGSCL